MRVYLKIDTLKRGWHDRDNLMLHAAFQTLVDFLEKEKPDEIVDWVGTGPEANAARTEMGDLYIWWKGRDPEACWDDDSQYEEDQTMLKRLVEIRGFMWS